jgi:hypothetical protein
LAFDSDLGPRTSAFKKHMDVKTYYRKLREIEAILSDETVLISKETAEGGRAGRFTEAPRAVAARLIVEGVAEQASKADAERYHEKVRQNYSDETRRRAAASIQVNVITEEQARALVSKPAPAPPARAGAKGETKADRN